MDYENNFLTFNIQKFDLVFKDVDKLTVFPVSPPYLVGGEFKVKISVILKREGYETNIVERKTLEVPQSLLLLFAKFKSGVFTESDVETLNSFISNISEDIVVDVENPINTNPSTEV